MARIDELHVEVHTNLTITDETVKRCLALVEMWLNDNPDKRIIGGYRDGDGDVLPFKIEKRVNDG